MAELIKREDDLNTGREKLNEAIKDSNKAKTDASNAVATSNQAKQIAQQSDAKSDTTQQQLDNIIIESGTSDAEVIQARGDHDLLYKRLDSTDAQLAENGQMLKRLNQDHDDFIDKLEHKVDKEEFRTLSYSEYGNVVLPGDFNHNINFNIYRDIDGKMKHDFNIDAYLNTGEWSKATYIYLSTKGTSQSDGLSESNPTNQLEKAFSVAENHPATHFKFKIMDKYFGRGNSIMRNKEKIEITKNIAIISDDDCWIGNINQPGTWVKEGNIYRYDRSAVRSIYDAKYRTVADLPLEYKKVDSIEECKRIPGSFWTDGDPNNATLVYVRTFDDREPDEDLLLSLGDKIEPAYDFVLLDDVQFITKNINMIHYKESAATLKITSVGNARGHVILHNSKIMESGHNGFMTNGIRYVWLFDVVVTKTKRDALNYHNTVSGDCFVLEYNCSVFDCGINDTNQNNNATTAHDGAHILRVNTMGWNTRGPVCIDVDGCYSILYDCAMFNSVRSDHALSKVAYHFAGTNGKALLLNCSGGGRETDLISTSDGMGTVFVRNLKGDLDRVLNTTIELIP